MANYDGNDGVVLVGANVVAEVRSFSYQESANTRNATKQGDTIDQIKVGTYAITGSIECWYDDTDSNGQEALSIGAAVTLELRPRGTGSGLPEYTITAEITELSVEVPEPNNTISRTFSFVGTAVDKTDQA